MIRYCFRVQRLLWKTDARWRPTPVQQFADLLGGQRPKFMNEADPRVELRVASQPFFHAWHSDQNQPEPPTVENIPYLLQPRHSQPVRFIDDEQGSGIGHRSLYAHGSVSLVKVSVLGFVRFGASIAVRVSVSITELFGAIQKSYHP
jgi:hypothetical protein